MFRFHIHTLFPDYFNSPLRSSILGRAIESGVVAAHLHDIRDWTTDKHRSADDEPFGGGGGMVMKVEPVVRSIESAGEIHGRVPTYLLSPAGERFGQEMAQRFALGEGMGLVCGHYEGIDGRVEAFVDGELSLGDFVLTGGEPAALAIMDSVARLLPGALGNAGSAVHESHTGAPILENPHFTRPRVFRGVEVPDVLFSGNHAAIAAWRRREALVRTRSRRPDLWARLHPTLTESDLVLIGELVPQPKRRRTKAAPTT